MKISLRIETKNHDETALCASALAFLGGLADRAASERERAREEARGWGAGPQKEGPPLQ